ncbi:MAG: hypothetical protein A2048_02975 [Deltaproteobacteria bacterium GWA2_45_12]|nr:MAG: hypothetical protein A2048_02975 [Deltaproteobacteria bacterium GWA2_45_12]
MKLKLALLGLVGLVFVSRVSVAQTPPPAAAVVPEVTIKCATLAPEGTTMTNSLKTMSKELATRTGGKVVFKMYYGGTAGDEKDVVRKMRIGQLNCGALTGVGLGMIEPEFRVLELPFLFKNYSAADHVMKEMRPYFETKIREKGFELLGWAEVGFVNIFSNKPITKKADLTGVKFWMWEGDVLAQTMFEKLGIVPIPLALTDVLTSLQTGLIDGCYAPPLGAIAFQWHTKTKYVTDVPLVDATGGIIVSKATWDSLKPEYQTILKEVITAESQKLITNSRSDNVKSLEVLKGMGLTVNQLTPEALAELQAISKDVGTTLVSKALFSQAILDKVTQLAASAP